MTTTIRSKRSPLTFAELESRVPAGTASRPISKFAYRLYAPPRGGGRAPYCRQ
jgi:hypothetical protein